MVALRARCWRGGALRYAPLRLFRRYVAKGLILLQSAMLRSHYTRAVREAGRPLLLSGVLAAVLSILLMLGEAPAFVGTETFDQTMR
jgi:hypothetical protein